MKKCSADTPVREKPRSAMSCRTGNFDRTGILDKTGSFERARLQPGRGRTRKSGALAPEGGYSR
jgi:hypothetical protein